MTPTAEAFLLLLRHAMWRTSARPLVELRQTLPTLEHVAESVRLSGEASGDFWGFFAGPAGATEVARALAVLQEGAWTAPSIDLLVVGAEICALLRV